MFTVRHAQDHRPNHAGRNEPRFTFSAEERADPLSQGFGILAVFDEERLPPRGRVLHVHHQVEVLTYVREGALAWSDARGGEGVLQATEFQRRTALRHAPHHEANASRTDWTQVFRIGFRSGVTLGTALVQRRFTVAERRGALRLVASPDGRGSSLRLAHDAFVYSSILDPGLHVVHELAPGRGAWLHVVQGAVTLDEQVLVTGDGAGAWSERAMSFTALEPTEVLLLDLGASAATTSN